RFPAGRRLRRHPCSCAAGAFGSWPRKSTRRNSWNGVAQRGKTQLPQSPNLADSRPACRGFRARWEDQGPPAWLDRARSWLLRRGVGFRGAAGVNVQGSALGIDFGGRQGAAGVALRIAARDGIEISNIEAILPRVSAHPIREFLQIAEGLLRRGHLIAARRP